MLTRPKRHHVVRAGLGLVAFFLLIQLVPYGQSRTNPPVTRAVRFDSPQTARLVAGACMDCHSNLTNWRWYDKVAPASWLVQRDIDGGRSNLNFSEWDKAQPPVSEVVAAIQGGGMPPIQYTLIHPAARLTDAQRAALIRGIEATYRKDPPARIRQGRVGDG